MRRNNFQRSSAAKLKSRYAVRVVTDNLIVIIDELTYADGVFTGYAPCSENQQEFFQNIIGQEGGA